MSRAISELPWADLNGYAQHYAKAQADANEWADGISAPMPAGYGWRLQAGAVKPVYFIGELRAFIFTDATGGEYRMQPVYNNVWATSEGPKVWLDWTTQKLYFPDGSWWFMNVVSSGLEADAGTWPG
ncbi:MAG: hypothetical protein ABI759_27815 [Candidatus Solibacter sp.]